MPNRIKVTKDDILNESLKIIRKEGIEALNARKIASKLGCSTQPIYYHFPTIVQLKECVKKEIRKIYSQYILESKKAEKLHFKAVGISYITFAIKEPSYFKILFMNSDNNKFEINAKVDDNYEYVLSTIREEYEIDEESAKSLYENIWVTTHGLAVMIATGFSRPTSEEINKILTNSFQGLLYLVKKGELR